MFKRIIGLFIIAATTMVFGMSLSKLNSASKTELMEINGIGDVKAAAIIKERRKGKFKSFDDLAGRVEGVGEQTAANIKNDIKVGEKVRKVKKSTAKKTAKKKTSSAKKKIKEKAEKKSKKTKSEMKEMGKKAEKKSKSKKSKAKKAEKELKKNKKKLKKEKSKKSQKSKKAKKAA